MRVVLADDQRDVRAALRLLLEQECCTVVAEASSVDELLGRTAHEQPELVLVDWELPGMPAEDPVRNLRALCPGVAIVALSSRPEARVAALAVGVDGFVSKADPPEALLAVVRACVRRAEGVGGREDPAVATSGKPGGARGLHRLSIDAETEEGKGS